MEAKEKITPKLAHQRARKWWKFRDLNRYILSEKPKRWNCPSKNIKTKKNPEKRATENRVGRPFNSELGSKNASLWSSAKGFKNCFRNAPINYRQTMPEDRFTSVKMNITRSRNHGYKWHSYKMSLKRMSWIFTKLPFIVHFFSRDARLYNSPS